MAVGSEAYREGVAQQQSKECDSRQLRTRQTRHGLTDSQTLTETHRVVSIAITHGFPFSNQTLAWITERTKGTYMARDVGS